MIANFRPCKRHADFIRAAAILAESHPEARFLMAGADHGTRPAVERAVEALGLEAKVRILEANSFPEKISAGLDICVRTSTTALRRAMGECGRKRVEQEFFLDRMVRKHQQLYCDLLRKWSAIERTNGCPKTRWS